MWQSEVRQLLQRFHVCLSCDSENQDQKHVSTSAASLKDHYPEDALYLFIAIVINRRKEECSFYVRATLNLNR